MTFFLYFINVDHRITTQYLQNNSLSVHQIRCSGNINNISQCTFDYYIPSLFCRYVVGLKCAGKYIFEYK